MNATKTATSKGFAYTVTLDGKSLTRTSTTSLSFGVAGTGNEYHHSGLWLVLRKTREAAAKVLAERGEGEIVEF